MLLGEADPRRFASLFKKYDMRIQFNICTVLIFLSLIAVSSCRQRSESQVDPYISGLTAEDTTMVLNTAEACMKAIKNRDFDGKKYKFGYFIDDTLYPMDSQKAEELLPLFKNMSILRYELSDYIFISEYDNIVKFRVKCHDGNSSMYTNLTFCPVRIDGGWYMTLR